MRVVCSQQSILAATTALLSCAFAACTTIHPEPVAPAVYGSASGGGTLRVGTMTLHRCRPDEDYYCGALRVTLDPAGQVPGTIDIALEWLPHANRGARSRGTIVAVEGGPGYPSIGSRAYYRSLFRPLLETRDMLLVDNRGTGRSGAIACHPLQGAPVMLLRDVTRCGQELGKRSDLYGTALAADDMAAVLTALRIRKVDMYGDSYGTFFVQAFAGRHPERVRSLVLDGAYQVIGGNPWYPSEGPTMRSAFNIACARSPVCAPLRGSSLDRIDSLLAALRAERHSKTTPGDIAFVMDSAGLDPLAYRDLDAAARAYVAGDRVPLERLVREAYTEEEGAGGRSRAYSQGLFVAASCSDNPQAYDMRLQPPDAQDRLARGARRQARARPAHLRPVLARRISEHSDRLRLRAALYDLAGRLRRTSGRPTGSARHAVSCRPGPGA